MSDMEKSSDKPEETSVEAPTVEEMTEEVISAEEISTEDIFATDMLVEEMHIEDAFLTEDIISEDKADEFTASVSEDEATGDDTECIEIVRSVERQKGVISYLRDLVFGLSFVLLAFMLVFRVVVVSGPSMMETLHDGDSLLLISNVFYRNPQYGDIIVASKDSFKDGEPIIKRVIATEGQMVDINFETGVVYVDGEPLDEPYTRTPTNYQEGMVFPLTVSEGCVFVMGDNRNDSLDSRSTQIGLIDRREILGRVLFLALPGREPYTLKRDLSRIGVLK